MKSLFFTALALFLFSCSDYPTKDENNPTEINVNIINETNNTNDLNDPSDNVTSESNSNSNSDSNSDASNSNSDNDTINIDNATG